ncbi:MAG: alpha/beta hydrolase [Actinobacteria bacterium]|nr:alpha/beta hydrolase [Actinomycetota bacterium]
MQEILDAFEELGPEPIHMLDPKEARKQPTPADAVERVLEKRRESIDPEPVASVDDRKIDNADSSLPLVGKNPIRIYTPEGEGPFPILVYYHGGGFVIADLDVYDSSPRALANAARCVVVSCDYRLAPEDPYPAAHNDAFAAYRWVLDNVDELGGNGTIAIAGESAGGNIACGTTLRARDEGLQMPVHQLLVYPIVDGDFSKPAFEEHAQAKPLSKPMMEWFAEHYAPEAGDPYFSNSNADLFGLPPTTIVNAEIDPLRDDGPLLAERLRSAGVEVEHRHYDGVTHEFFGMGAALDAAKEAVNYAAGRMSRSFEKSRARA